MKLLKLILLGLTTACASTVKVPKNPIIDGHLTAYNAHDIVAFKKYFHKDVEIYKFPNTLVDKGKDNLDQYYTPLFDKKLNQAKIHSRMEFGKFVIDHEEATIKDKTAELLVIYETKDGLIYRMMFVGTVIKDNK